MNQLPIMLNLKGKNTLVVGGGTVAQRRTQSLLECNAIVTVVAPNISELIHQLPVTKHQRAYHHDDLTNIFAVVIATDNPKVNQQVASEAAAANILINRADGQQSDFSIPAYQQLGPITLAISTSGCAPNAAAQLCVQLANQVDPDWPILIECANNYRTVVQQYFPEGNKRRRLLVDLTGPTAMQNLKNGGKAQLQAYYEQLLQSRD